MLGKVAKRFSHLLGTSCAVEADDVNTHGFDRRQRRADFCSRKHATSQLNGDLDLDRDSTTNFFHRDLAGVDRRLCAKQIEHRFDEEEV